MSSYKTYAAPGGEQMYGVAYVLDPRSTLNNGETGLFRPLSIYDLALPQQYSTAPSSDGLTLSGGSIVSLGVGEKAYVQNLGINPLYLKRGTGATTGSFHYILAAGTANDDGSGGAIEIDDYIGALSVTGTSPRYVAWKA